MATPPASPRAAPRGIPPPQHSRLPELRKAEPSPLLGLGWGTGVMQEQDPPGDEAEPPGAPTALGSSSVLVPAVPFELLGSRIGISIG